MRYARGKAYEALYLATVVHRDPRSSTRVLNFERKLLNVRLHHNVVKPATDKTLGIVNGIERVHFGMVLGGITDEALGIGEGHIGWGDAVTLVVRDDIDATVLPHGDAATNVSLNH